jgi:hypothetical protein
MTTDRTREIARLASRQWMWEHPGCYPSVNAETRVRIEEELTDAIEAAICEAEQGRWVPVSERLPENYAGVFFVHPESENAPCIGWYVDDDGSPLWHCYACEDDYGENVTHWQPIPSAPEGKGEKE